MKAQIFFLANHDDCNAQTMGRVAVEVVGGQLAKLRLLNWHCRVIPDPLPLPLKTD